jgi:hypothetical protein
MRGTPLGSFHKARFVIDHDIPFACERPLCAKSGPSLTIIIYVRNIFGLATKEASHPSMMETSRATTSAVPPTADIVGHRGHVRKVPNSEVALLTRSLVGAGKQQRQNGAAERTARGS